MRTPLRHVARTAAVLAPLVWLSSCATTINSAANTVASTIVTTTTVPRGNASELLAQLIESTRGLSTAVAEGNRAVAVSQLSNMKAQWQALKPQLGPDTADIVTDVQRMVDLATSAVTRKRPADADKALLLLPIITSALNDSSGN